VAACAPFGPLPTDGGGGGSGSTVDSSNDVASADAAEVPQELPSESAAGKPNGASCAGEGECSSGHCVEGTCCGTACSTRCVSCIMSNTGQPDGTCAPVEAGLAHASDCVANDSTTCGLDGKCDGAGACRNYVAGTMCAPEACTDASSVSSYNSVRTCDGRGTCAAGTTSQCGSAYRCSGTKCRTTCGSSQDCVSGAYCSGTTCAAKKPDGQVCSSAIECATGVCGGLCCAAGCTCTQADPTNILKNPGFDKDASGWTIDVGTLSRSVYDFDECPYSGSLIMTLPANISATLSQCVADKPLVGIFNFGVELRIEDINGTTAGGAGGLCLVRFYTVSIAMPTRSSTTKPTT
jgi:hypothetical protein